MSCAHREILRRDPAIPERDTCERDVELAGADGPGDGGSERGGVLPAVGLGDQEQQATLQRGHLPD